MISKHLKEAATKAQEASFYRKNVEYIDRILSMLLQEMPSIDVGQVTVELTEAAAKSAHAMTLASIEFQEKIAAAVMEIVKSAKQTQVAA